MAWTTKAIYIGSHFWFVPVGTAFTVPGAGAVTQNGTWPGGADPLWPSWKLGACAMFDIDPKYGPSEDILEPSPGAVQATDEITPYALPEVKFSFLKTDVLALQLALNTPALWATANTVATPNAGGGPGLKGILKCQKYAQDNTLLANWTSWVSLKLSGSFKGDPKTMTKPEYIGKLLYSVNNLGAV